MRWLKLIVLGVGLLWLKDAHASSADSLLSRCTKNYRFQSSAQIAKKLTAGVSDDSIKNCLIQRWICNHIRYDSRKYQKGKRPSEKVKKVLHRRKAFCMGYANLYSDLLSHCGIESEVVVGYGKGLAYRKNDLFYRENHAWNAVNINGQWHLSDLTWASGNMLKKPRLFRKYLFNTFGLFPFIKNKYRFKKELDTLLFNAAPEYFIKTHLPTNPMWQLLELPQHAAQFVFPDSSFSDTLTSKYNYHDSITNFVSNNKAIKAKTNAKSSLPNNQNDRETAAYNLSIFLDLNYKNITTSTTLSVEEKRDSLKHTLNDHDEALSYFDAAMRNAKSEYNYLEKRNSDRKKKIVLENQKRIRDEQAIRQKNKSKNKQLKNQIKQTNKSRNGLIASRNRALSNFYKSPRKEKKSSDKQIKDALTGLEKAEVNLITIAKLQQEMDSIVLHSDTLALRRSIEIHNAIDSFYTHNDSLQLKNIEIAIEYDYDLEDSLFRNRDTVRFLHYSKKELHSQLKDEEKALINASISQLRERYKYCKKLITENKLHYRNAEKYLGDYNVESATIDSLETSLFHIYELLISLQEVKTDVLGDEMNFNKKEILLSKIATKNYSRENDIETIRYNYERKMNSKQLKAQLRQLSKEKSSCKESKNNYKTTLKLYEQEIKAKQKRVRS